MFYLSEIVCILLVYQYFIKQWLCNVGANSSIHYLSSLVHLYISDLLVGINKWGGKENTQTNSSEVTVLLN